MVEEEMRRTIEFGYWQAAVWEVRATTRSRGVDDVLREGLVAYAQEHVTREQVTSARLQKRWGGIRGKGQAYLARQPLSEGETVLVSVGDDAGDGDDDEDDEEEEQGQKDDEEGEGDEEEEDE